MMSSPLTPPDLDNRRQNLVGKSKSYLSTRLFSARQIIFLTLLFGIVIVVAQRSLRYVCTRWLEFDCPFYWPISVFGLRLPTLRDLIVAGLVLITFFLTMKYLEAKKFNLGVVITLGALLIAGTNLIQGLDVGFYAPIAGDSRSATLIPNTPDGQEYYHDALRVSDPLTFFGRYNEIQTTLHQHAHTHPPGAVLTLYFLAKLFREPPYIALVITLIATAATVLFFYRLVRTETGSKTARFMSFLIVLVPAIQVYYLATLDALITAVLTATLYLFCFSAGYRGVIGAAVTLTASFLLTFVSLFILPVLVGFELILKRSIKRSLLVIGGVVIVHVLFYLVAGYNAALTFLTASRHENPSGFMLFADPSDYFFTRVENVAEVAVFFGPFLLVLFIRGLRDFQFKPLAVLTGLGCLTLLLMYVIGAWRTGETARACAFIYPYLLFPVGSYLDRVQTGASQRLQLATLVFVQSVLMQTFGWYYW